MAEVCLRPLNWSLVYFQLELRLKALVELELLFLRKFVCFLTSLILAAEAEVLLSTSLDLSLLSDF